MLHRQLLDASADTPFVAVARRLLSVGTMLVKHKPFRFDLRATVSTLSYTQQSCRRDAIDGFALDKPDDEGDRITEQWEAD